LVISKRLLFAHAVVSRASTITPLAAAKLPDGQSVRWLYPSYGRNEIQLANQGESTCPALG
jgi:hypothetical protein